VERVLLNEFRTFEEDFFELDTQKEVESYANTLLRVRSIGGQYGSETRNEFKEIVLGDKYVAGQVGVQGPHGHAHDMTFNQVWAAQAGSIDLERVAQDLAKLRAEMRKQATDPSHDKALGAVAAAEEAAADNNGAKVMENLRAAGKWAFDVATKIGTTVAADALKAALGMK